MTTSMQANHTFTGLDVDKVSVSPGETGAIFFATDTDLTYIWTGVNWVEVSGGIALDPSLPLALGAAAAGSSACASHGDHVHKMGGAWIQRISVGVSTYYDADVAGFLQAVIDASDNDAIMVPAGTYNFTNLSISKPLSVVGAGDGITIFNDSGTTTLNETGFVSNWIGIRFNASVKLILTGMYGYHFCRNVSFYTPPEVQNTILNIYNSEIYGAGGNAFNMNGTPANIYCYQCYINCSGYVVHWVNDAGRAELHNCTLVGYSSLTDDTDKTFADNSTVTASADALIVTPVASDRSTFRVDGVNASLHASDINAATPIQHNPIATASGQAPVWDGSKWVARALELADVTVGGGIGTPDYTTLDDWFDTTRSSGRISGGTISNHGDGTVDITGYEGMLFVANSIVGPVVFVKMAAANVGSITDKSVNFIYLSYDGGTPAYHATTDRSTIHEWDQVVVGRVFRDGTEVEIMQSGHNIYNKNRRAHDRLILKYGSMDYVSGALVSQPANLLLAMTAGSWYVADYPYTTAAVDMNAGGWVSSFYRSGASTWTESGHLTSALDITQWNRLSDNTLQNLSSGHYGIYWLYVTPFDHFHIVYGQESYSSLANVQAASAPSSLPPELTNWGRLIGRAIFKKSATAFAEVDTVFGTIPFTFSAPTDHNELSGLQGGTAGEYYHLTSSEHSSIAILGTAIPLGVGTAAAGSSACASHDDHVHPTTGLVLATRNINTSFPLSGGGALSGDLTLTISAASDACPGSLSAADKTKLDGIATGTTFAFHNYLINGGFEINQRGATVVKAAVATPDSYLVDRWRGNCSNVGSGQRLTYTVDWLVTTNSVQSATFTSSVATGKFMVAQIIENGWSRSMGGKTVTFQITGGGALSSGALRIGIFGVTGTDNSVAAALVSAWNGNGVDPTWTGLSINLLASQSCAMSVSVTTFSLTLALPSSYPNLIVGMWTENAVTAGSYIFVGECQLTISTQAQPWLPRPQQQELALCQRYTWATGLEDTLIAIGQGQCVSTTSARACIFLPVQMRVSPIIESYGTYTDYGATIANGNLQALSAAPTLAANSATPKSVIIVLPVASGLVAGNACIFRKNSTASSVFVLSAEL